MSLLLRVTADRELEWVEIDGNFTYLDDRITTANSQISTLNGVVVSNTGTIGSHTASIASLNSTVSGHTASLGTNSAAIGVNTAAIISSNTAIGINSSNISAANALIAAIQTILGKTAKVLKQRYSPVIRTALNTVGGGTPDNGYFIHDSFIVPAGTMGLNSRLNIVAVWNNTIVNNALTKTFAIDWGGSNVGTAQNTTLTSYDPLTEIFNQNSLTSQYIQNNVSYGTGGAITTAKDTAGAVQIDFKSKWSAAAAITETITLIGYSIIHIPGV